MPQQRKKKESGRLRGESLMICTVFIHLYMDRITREKNQYQFRTLSFMSYNHQLNIYRSCYPIIRSSPTVEHTW